MALRAAGLLGGDIDLFAGFSLISVEMCNWWPEGFFSFEECMKILFIFIRGLVYM